MPVADCVRHGGRERRDHTFVVSHDHQRAAAFSRQLRQAHQHLRDQLTRISEGLGDGEHPERDLQVYCLAFCSALTAHHLGEDDRMFPALRDARPDLAPTIRKLVEDHAAIAAILSQIRGLAGQAETAPAERLPGLRREFDGLAAIMESHFRYEERALSTVLDSTAPGGDALGGGWTAAVFDPGGAQPP